LFQRGAKRRDPKAEEAAKVKITIEAAKVKITIEMGKVSLLIMVEKAKAKPVGPRMTTIGGRLHHTSNPTMRRTMTRMRMGPEKARDVVNEGDGDSTKRRKRSGCLQKRGKVLQRKAQARTKAANRLRRLRLRRLSRRKQLHLVAGGAEAPKERKPRKRTRPRLRHLQRARAKTKASQLKVTLGQKAAKLGLERLARRQHGNHGRSPRDLRCALAVGQRRRPTPEALERERAGEAKRTLLSQSPQAEEDHDGESGRAGSEA